MNSSFFWTKALSSAGTFLGFGHPFMTYAVTLARIGSLLVYLLTSSTSTGLVSISSMLICTGGCSSSSARLLCDHTVWSSVKGRCDRASAFWCCLPSLCTMSYSYADRIICHWANRADAIGLAGLLSPNIPNSGLWSVTMVNLCPNKYLWNFFSPKMTGSPSFWY